MIEQRIKKSEFYFSLQYLPDITIDHNDVIITFKTPVFIRYIEINNLKWISKFFFIKEIFTSCLLNITIRTTTTASVNAAITQDKQVRNESQGYDYMYVLINSEIKRSIL